MSDETGREPTRSELTLVRSALRQDWPVPPVVKGQILQRLIDYLDREHLEGATASDRQVVMAARTVIEFLKLNLKQQRLDLDRDRHEAAQPEPDHEERKPRIIIPGSPGAKRPKGRPKTPKRARKR